MGFGASGCWEVTKEASVVRALDIGSDHNRTIWLFNSNSFFGLSTIDSVKCATLLLLHPTLWRAFALCVCVCVFVVCVHNLLSPLTHPHLQNSCLSLKHQIPDENYFMYDTGYPYVNISEHGFVSGEKDMMAEILRR